MTRPPLTSQLAEKTLFVGVFSLLFSFSQREMVIEDCLVSVLAFFRQFLKKPPSHTTKQGWL